MILSLLILVCACNSFCSGLLLAGTNDPVRINVWNMDNSSNITSKSMNNQTGVIRALRSLNDYRMASGSTDSSIAIWDTRNYSLIKMIKPAHNDSVFALELIDQKYLISASVDMSIKVWDLISYVCIYNITPAHSGDILALKEISVLYFVSGSTDKTLKMWRKSDFSLFSTLTGHTNTVSCFDILANGSLISGSLDNRVKIWTPQGQGVNLVNFGANVKCVKLLQNNDLAIVGGTKFEIWKLNSTYAAKQLGSTFNNSFTTFLTCSIYGNDLFMIASNSSDIFIYNITTYNLILNLRPNGNPNSNIWSLSQSGNWTQRLPNNCYSNISLPINNANSTIATNLTEQTTQLTTIQTDYSTASAATKSSIFSSTISSSIKQSITESILSTVDDKETIQLTSIAAEAIDETTIDKIEISYSGANEILSEETSTITYERTYQSRIIPLETSSQSTINFLDLGQIDIKTLEQKQITTLDTSVQTSVQSETSTLETFVLSKNTQIDTFLQITNINVKNFDESTVAMTEMLSLSLSTSISQTILNLSTVTNIYTLDETSIALSDLNTRTDSTTSNQSPSSKTESLYLSTINTVKQMDLQPQSTSTTIELSDNSTSESIPSNSYQNFEINTISTPTLSSFLSSSESITPIISNTESSLINSLLSTKINSQTSQEMTSTTLNTTTTSKLGNFSTPSSLIIDLTSTLIDDNQKTTTSPLNINPDYTMSGQVESQTNNIIEMTTTTECTAMSRESNISNLTSVTYEMTTEIISTRLSLDVIAQLSANISAVLATLPSSQFSLSSLSGTTVTILLNSKLDVADCITNCSNQGVCKLTDTNKLICECKNGYMGNKCQSSASACSYEPCVNNATCVDTNSSSTITSYTCKCVSDLYYGTNCEYKINPCQNETCSSNGNCKSENDKPVCDCFPLYLGDHCEFETSQKKAIKAMISTASIIAIVIMVLLLTIIVLIDLFNFVCTPSSDVKLRLKLKKHRLKKAKKFIYIA